MIVVHHLENSRSQRILWMLEHDVTKRKSASDTNVRRHAWTFIGGGTILSALQSSPRRRFTLSCFRGL